MENKENKLKIIKFLLAVLGVFYIVFMSMDLFELQTFRHSNMLKFISMILVFIISLIAGRNVIGVQDILLLRIGLLITLIADVFLLLINSYYILGVGLFSIVQIIYSIRYKPENAKNIIKNFGIIGIILCFTYAIINQYIIEIDFLIIIGIYYALCLLSSTTKAIQIYKNKLYSRLNSKIIVSAMILFFLCDINVAVYNIIKSTDMSLSFTIALYNISFISIWFFYLPSQVLLSLSGYSSDFLKDILITEKV